MDYDYSRQWEKWMRRFPNFLDKSDDSNFSKVNRPVFNQLMAYRNACFIESLSMDLDRPIKIWKEQSNGTSYTYRYEVNIPYLREVTATVYNADGDILDSETWTWDTADETSFLSSDTAYYNGVWDGSNNGITTDYIIVEASTYTEYYLRKGYPENDGVYITGSDGEKVLVPNMHEYDEDGNPIVDIFDHELCLDELGELLNVKRYTNLTYTDDTDYSRTYPREQYTYKDNKHIMSGDWYNHVTEDDYHYAQRIRGYMGQYGVIPLSMLEIWKYYQIYPELFNRKNRLLHMFCPTENSKITVDGVSEAYTNTPLTFTGSFYNLNGGEGIGGFVLNYGVYDNSNPDNPVLVDEGACITDDNGDYTINYTSKSSGAYYIVVYYSDKLSSTRKQFTIHDKYTFNITYVEVST